jgi:phospholipid/cholesterol/gamma-HCH transport system substrate-binding protein
MMQSKTVEIAVGMFVALGVGALFVLAMQVSNLSNLGGDDGYEIKAGFDNIGGLKVRSPVTVAGVRVGRVAAIDYNADSYQAEVVLRIDPRFDGFALDTSASIFTSGLLGEQYIALDPGGDEEYLKDGDRITLTQSALVLEQMIGKFLFNQGEGQ